MGAERQKDVQLEVAKLLKVHTRTEVPELAL
jgi:hypothetical protein